MGSCIRCKCDYLVHKNLYCGTDIALIVTDYFLDIERSSASAEDLASELNASSDRLHKCKGCDRLIVLRESRDAIDIKFYLPENT